VAAGSDLRLPAAVQSLLSTYLLLAIGIKGGHALTRTSLGFVDLFPGLLVLFLLDLGVGTAQRLRSVREAGGFVIAFAVVAPLLLGAAGALAGSAAGLGPGGAAVFGAMTASASYIAAPAAAQPSPHTRRRPARRAAGILAVAARGPDAGVAQLAEQRSCKAKVVGSTPIPGSTVRSAHTASSRRNRESDGRRQQPQTTAGPHLAFDM
jgi:hypothetical protein